MSKPVIAAISRTALAGGFEFALSCDLRIAEDGDYLIGLPEANRGLLPGTAGTQRLLRTIGTPAALMHNRALPDAELDDFIDALARRIASFDRRAVVAAK